MHETDDDLVALQGLLDASYEAAGDHLRRVITPERRLSASALCSALVGMRLLVLATVTADGRPINGPVDSIFYRGAFYFGSARDSVRLRHIATRPWVSASHLPGEELAVTVHGRAQMIDVDAPEHAGFRRTLLGIYVPRYGEDWVNFLAEASYARIEAQQLFTFSMPTETVES